MDDSQQTLTKSGPWPDDSGPVSIFVADDLVDGRYRILRFIARGGAAEVYEVEDRELGQRLALKALRRDPAKARTIERFKREINLARQVTHPNVCRIYEFGHHGDDVLFLTMELLDGETLLDRIRRGGSMRPAEALPLVRQMAAGLDAAHTAGVIHRDFKCGNVMLVPSMEAGVGLRAVITDFGLARAAVEDDPGPHVTAHDTLVGTPAYMAPEQVESAKLTPSADIYAFGVVLYEMLTGRYPFQGESSLATAIMRLKQAPTPPTTYAPDLGERWEKTVLCCLERRPRDRFVTAGQVIEALEGEYEVRVRRADVSIDETVERGQRRGVSSAAAGVVMAIVLVAVAGIGWWSRPMRDPPPIDAGTAAESRRSIALLGFRNLSGNPDSEWLSTALSEMLATEVAAGEQIRVIPGEYVAQTKIELGLEDVESPPPETVSRVGDILSANLVVVGSYVAAGDGGDIRLDLRVRSASTGETLARVSERGEVLDLVEKAGRALRGELGLAGLSQAEADAVKKALPADPRSAELYARGLEELRLYNAEEALELLEAAARRDPDHPLIHSALSAAWNVLGYRPRAQEESRRAVELAVGLSRRDRLWVEARHHEITNNGKQAVENYRLLWDFYPDNLEYGLRLAVAQARVFEGEAALETVARLRGRSSAVGTDPRIELAEAEAARSLAQYSKQQLRAAEGARKAEALGARLLVARAREVEAAAFRDLGQPDKALAAYAEAREIFEAANDRGAVAGILIALSTIHRYQARFEEGRALVEEALEVAREIGDQGTIRLALGNLALLARSQGKLSEALAMHEMELEAAREIGARRSIQIATTTLGVVHRDMGNLDGARTNFEHALALSRESGNQRSIAINLNLLGEVYLRQGRLTEARQLFEAALAANQRTHSPRDRAYYLSYLGDAERAAGRLAEARGHHEEALAIRESLGEKTNMAYSRLALADLDLEEGLTEGAAALASEAMAEFRLEKRSDAEGYALAFLARSLLRQDRLGEAESEITRALELLRASENQEFRLRVRLCAAEIDAALGRRQQASTALLEILDGALGLGFVDLRLEVGLVLGQVESETDPAAGTARLEAVAKEAAEHGYQRIAGKARSSVKA